MTATEPHTDTALLLSGGVDSAVAAAMLCRQGIRPDCFYIKIGPEEDTEWDCTAEEDIEMATAVAARYGLSFDIVDCHREYWDHVARYTIDTVRAGATPNPDVMCNQMIKFGAFNDKAGHRYRHIATGHYATTECDDEGRTWLCRSPDPVKDQTDFLAQLHPWQLQKAVFPIGHMMKDDVRRLAEAEHLVNAHRHDSQGICFLGRVNYNEYIRRYLGDNPGRVIDIDTGRVLGQHRGLWYHTIGQRHGLGFGGGPWFAVKKDLRRNILLVSRGYDPKAAYRQQFSTGPMHWLTAPVPLDGADIMFKIRHTTQPQHAVITPRDDGYDIAADRPIHGVAQGQFCVVYDRHAHRCLGSAVIA